GGRRRHRRHAQPPLLLLPRLPPAGPLALAHHHHLVLQRVPLLLARVVAPLPPLGAARRPLRAVEKKLADLLGPELDPALGDAEEAGQQWLDTADGAADGGAVHREEEAEEDVADVGPVVDQQGEQLVRDAEGELGAGARPAPAAGALPAAALGAEPGLFDL